MNAVVKMEKDYDHMVYKDVPEPTVKGDLVKIKIAYSGVCGTDLHAFKGTYASTQPPVILGHEFSGIVTEVGPEVVDIRVGDRVTSETTFATCMQCPYCLSGDFNLCSNRRGIGTQENGSMAEYVVSHESRVHRLPPNVGYLSASLSEPLACAVHAVMEKGEIKKGETVCVFGAGAIGQMVAQVAKACGATVVIAGIKTDKERLEIARKNGVDRAVDQQSENLSAVLKELTNGVGVDAAVECSGAIPAANKALEVVKKKGRVIQMGVFPKEREEIATDLILHREIMYIGSRSQKPTSWKTAIELMRQGTVVPEKIVTHIVPLVKWRDAFDAALRGEGCKMVIHCNEDLK